MGIEQLKQNRAEILRIAEEHGARNVRVFGSVVRDEAGPDSDIDFLVELEKGRSLMDLAGLSIDLEELLGVEVDVLTDGGVHPYLREYIYAEAAPL